MNATANEHWDIFWTKIDALYVSLAKSKAVNVNTKATHDDSRELVQHYFRSVRPELGALGISDNILETIDNPLQELLRLANGRNKRSSYRKVVRILRNERTKIELERERLLGRESGKVEVVLSSSGVEKQILTTLQTMIPSAALSYLQATQDLKDRPRISYRGTAVELREALREVLDHLAPDDVLLKTEGFKLEKNLTRPTMKQKARFILRSRGLGSTALSSPQDAVVRVEEGTASLARSVYERGSVSTHVATTREEVLQLKLYVDGVLAELLQIH